MFPLVASAENPLANGDLKISLLLKLDISFSPEGDTPTDGSRTLGFSADGDAGNGEASSDKGGNEIVLETSGTAGGSPGATRELDGRALDTTEATGGSPGAPSELDGKPCANSLFLPSAYLSTN